jgi:hypothetical protein
MPTIKKDFKDLRVSNTELDFQMGFVSALAVIAVVLKIAGVLV